MSGVIYQTLQGELLREFLRATHESGIDYHRVRKSFDAIAEWIGFKPQALLDCLNRAYKYGSNV